MSKQEGDFREQAEQFADETRDTAEDKFQTRHDYLAGCEHGYQYAVEKACEVIARLYPQAAAYYEQPETFVEQIRKAMED